MNTKMHSYKKNTQHLMFDALICMTVNVDCSKCTDEGAIPL